MDANVYKCSLAGCDGPNSGVCINGLSTEECPEILLIQDIEYTEIPEEIVRSGTDMVVTRGASSLDASSCDALLRERGGIVVGVVAGPEVGKTTMIATIYELLHRGRIPNIIFGGSETLRGYEERCHLARMASNGLFPDTPRTPTSAKLSFTHLRLLTPSGIQDVIFSDRSGEHFDNVLNQPKNIIEFTELARANIILLLVDIEKLLNSPHQLISRTRRLLIAMHEQSLLSGKPVRLIGTKADLAKSQKEVDRAHDLLRGLAEDLRRRVKHQIEIVPLLIATRPRAGTTAIAEGLAELIDEIISEIDSPIIACEPAWPAQPTAMDALMQIYRSKGQ